MLALIKLFRIASLLIFGVFAFSSSVQAQEWGYEDYSDNGTESSVTPMKATQHSLQAPKKKSVQADKKVKQSTSKLETLKNPLVGLDHKSPQYAWLQILGLVSPAFDHSKIEELKDFTLLMSGEQKQRYLKFLNHEIKSGNQQYSSITGYWADLQRALAEPEHRSNYRLLFRSLIRMKVDEIPTTKEEKEVLLEAVGPAMLAVSGKPSLSQDAVKAYSDMACFMYEQNHPGKTIDADDNRKVFELVIRDKFKKAPAFADRLAMSYFPINWAKFRILYTDASESDRKVLVRKLSSTEKSSTHKVSNPLLEKVLSNQPWKEIVVRANKRTKLVGQKAKVRALKLGEMQ